MIAFDARPDHHQVRWMSGHRASRPLARQRLHVRIASSNTVRLVNLV